MCLQSGLSMPVPAAAVHTRSFAALLLSPILVVSLVLISISPRTTQAESCIGSSVKKWKVKMHLTQVLNQQGILESGPECTANYVLALSHDSEVTGEFSNVNGSTLWQGNLTSQEIINNTMDIPFTGRPECSYGDVFFTEIGSETGAEENASLVIDQAAGKYTIAFPHTGVDITTTYDAPNVPPPAGPVHYEGVMKKEINGDYLLDYPGMVLQTSPSDPVTTLEFPLPVNPGTPITGETSFPHSKYPAITITWSWELTPDLGGPESDLGNPNGNGQANGGESAPGSGYGAPAWTVNMANLNIYLTDSPLWYHNPVGPSLELNLSYNSQSVTSRFEPVGNKWQLNYFSYLSADEITSDVTIYMPDGRRDVYTFSPAGFTAPYRVFNELKITRQGEMMEGNDYELTFPDGTVYVYKVPSGSLLWAFLTEIRDPHGNKLSLQWEGLAPWGGKLKQITDALGRNTTFFYNADDRIISVSDPFGRSAGFQYDSLGNLTRITDMGGYWTSFSYDDCGTLLTMSQGSNTWNFESDSEGLTVRDNMGSERFTLSGVQGSASYQGAGADAGVVSSYSLAPAQDGSNHTDVTNIQTAEGTNFDFSYDAEGNLLTDTLRAATGNETSTFTYNAKGKITSVINPLGARTQLTYASNSVDLLKLQDGLGSITATYNTKHDILSLTDRMGATSSYTYNSLGQVLSATDTLGTRTTYTYNAQHQLIRITRGGTIVGTYQYDYIGRVSAYTDVNGFTRHYTYNDLDDLLGISYPDGTTISYSRSSTIPHQLETMTDQGGKLTTYEYNVHRQLTKIIDPQGGISRFSYDPSGHMMQLTDPNGNATSFVYNKDNRLTQKKYPDASTSLFSYTNGRLKWAKNARGIQTTYTFDKNGNLLKTQYSDSTPTVTTVYDAYNRPTSITDALGTHLISYDSSSRVTSIDGPWPGDTLTFSYDARGRKISVALLNGPTVSYGYDYLDRLTSVSGGDLSYSYGYQGSTLLLNQLQRSDNSLTEYSYEATMQRLRQLTGRNQTGEILYQQTFSHDANGLQLEEMVVNGPALQLTKAGSEDYTYNNLNQAISLGGSTAIFSYDLDGNMTKGITAEGKPFDAVYDAENRLTSIQYTDEDEVTKKEEYVYGADGFAGIQKSYANGVLTAERHFIRNAGRVLQERNGANMVTRSYIWGVAQRGGVGGLLGLVQDGQTYQYFSNARGDITAVLDSSGSVVASYGYDPYGTPLTASGSLSQPFRFSTKEYDGGTGLYYYGHRFFSPAMGRWLSRDPLAEVASINLYTFSGNNPIDRYDPFGAEDFSGLRPEHQAQAKAMYDAIQAKREAQVSTTEKITQGIGSAFRWIGDKFKENPEAAKTIVDTVVDTALDTNKYTKDGKEWNERINKGFELAEDIAEIRTAYYDKDPASGLTLLKQGVKHTVRRIPVGGDTLAKVLTKGIETVETAPGGVKAMRNVGDRADAAYRAGK